MKSFSKFDVDCPKVRTLFEHAGFSPVTRIEALTSGEFNTAFLVTASGRDYVIKISPSENTKVLTYEKNMMAREVEYCKIVRKNTSVRVPKIYFSDFSRTLIPADYYIMEKIPGKPLNEITLTKKEKDVIKEQLGGIIAELHSVKGFRFGYDGSFTNWYDAIRSMTMDLINDCKAVNHSIGCGVELLEQINKYKDILSQVKSTYTHYDIWDGNIFVDKNDDGTFSLAIIDMERSFWGDRMGDFCSIDCNVSLSKKDILLHGYNLKSDCKIFPSQTENIRYGIMLSYLSLVMHTEKYYRYEKSSTKYLTNMYLEKKLFALASRYFSAGSTCAEIAKSDNRTSTYI